jgi:hypothetical protein
VCFVDRPLSADRPTDPQRDPFWRAAFRRTVDLGRQERPVTRIIRYARVRCRLGPAALQQPQRQSITSRSSGRLRPAVRSSGTQVPRYGTPRGGCPNYVIDHIKPLAIGGVDAPCNMHWQTIKAAKAKDKIECYGHPCSRH